MKILPDQINIKNQKIFLMTACRSSFEMTKACNRLIKMITSMYRYQIINKYQNYYI